MERTDRLASPFLHLDADGRLKARRWRVTVVAGPDVGRALDVTGPTVVGSGPSAHLQLTDGAVSRHHVELEPRAQGLFVRDLGSTNGTVVGGARVDELTVERQASLVLGRTTIALSSTDDSVEAGDGPTHLEGLVAQSAQMRRLFALVERLGPTDTPVMLLGETGTGKEGLARALHRRSLRRQGPFVVVDCGAVASGLVESELFGHARGAFTGAATERPGAFVEAEGGTLFLDEVAELPLELQPKLLRALEARQVKRLGEDRYRSVDVRVVAATHRDLEAEVKAGRFRADLFYRVAVAALRVPPLRERREDVPLLVESLLSQLGAPTFALSPELMGTLSAYEWPGNVRELRNVVARAVVSDQVSVDSVLNPAALGRSAAGATAEPALTLPFKAAKERLVDGFTREYLSALHTKHGGNVSAMARASGLARPYLHELLVKYGFKATGGDPAS